MPHPCEREPGSLHCQAVKTCSACGTINANLTLADRVYDCSNCALVIDRDVNAAVNLARYTPPPPKASPLPAAA